MPRWSGGNEHDRSGTGEERYAALCAECESSKRSGLLNHHVVLCKVRLVGTWIKRREVVTGARRNRSEKLREHQYMEEYAWFLDGKRIERDERSRNIDQMRE